MAINKLEELVTNAIGKVPYKIELTPSGLNVIVHENNPLSAYVIAIRTLKKRASRTGRALEARKRQL